MSLANLSLAYEAMRFRTRLAEDQVNDMSETLAQCFLDKNKGARKILIEIARMHREEHPKALKPASERPS